MWAKTKNEDVTCFTRFVRFFWLGILFFVNAIITLWTLLLLVWSNDWCDLTHVCFSIVPWRIHWPALFLTTLALLNVYLVGLLIYQTCLKKRLSCCFCTRNDIEYEGDSLEAVPGSLYKYHQCLPRYLHHFHKGLSLFSLMFGAFALFALNFIDVELMPILRRACKHMLPFLLPSITLLIALLWWPISSFLWSTLPVNRKKRHHSISTPLAAVRSSIWWISALVFFLFCLAAPFWVVKYNPCITDEPLPLKPKIFAHRGVTRIGPENTMSSFGGAISVGTFGIETDVRISQDGVPFILHDETFERTTNVKEVYPTLVNLEADFFTSDQIESLSANNWVIGSCGSPLINNEDLYSNATVPIFSDVIALCQKNSLALIFDMLGPPDFHPYYNSFLSSLMKILEDKIIDPSLVFWLHPSGGDDTMLYLAQENGFTLVYQSGTENEETSFILDRGFSVVNTHYGEYDGRIKEWSDSGLLVNTYTVNTRWLYSQMWCLGVDSVTTNSAIALKGMTSPLGNLSLRTYRIVVSVVDVVSLVLVLAQTLLVYKRNKRSELEKRAIHLNSF